MDTMKNFEQVSLSWDGISNRAFLEDAMAHDTQGGGSGNLGAHLVLTAKSSTLAEQIGMLAVAAGVQPLVDKNPMFAMLLAAARVS